MTVSKIITDIQASMEAELLVFACRRLGCNPNDDDADMAAIHACMNDTLGAAVRERYVTHYRWDIIQSFLLKNIALMECVSAEAIAACVDKYLIYAQVVENKF